MAMLVSLAEAKEHLRLDHDGLDLEVQAMVEAATAVIFDYLKLNIEDYEDSQGDLVGIKASWKYACMVWISILFEDQDDNTEVGQIPRKVSRLLYIDRNLTLTRSRPLDSNGDPIPRPRPYRRCGC